MEESKQVKEQGLHLTSFTTHSPGGTLSVIYKLWSCIHLTQHISVTSTGQVARMHMFCTHALKVIPCLSTPICKHSTS